MRGAVSTPEVGRERNALPALIVMVAVAGPDRTWPLIMLTILGAEAAGRLFPTRLRPAWL
jgi:hypothetical protein